MTSRFSLMSLALLTLLALMLARPEPMGAQPTPTPPAGTPPPTTDATAQPTADATDPGAATCPAIVETALRVVKEACASLQADEICYGYLVLEASPRTGLTDFTFVQPGDIADIVDIQSLRLNAMDTARGVWGVVLMQVLSDPADPNSPPMTILLFGDAQLDTDLQFVPVTALRDLDIYPRPASVGDPSGALTAGQDITANGRLDDGSWLRVRLISIDRNELGWLPADAVTSDSDLSALPVIDPDAPPADDAAFGPMQAFSFQSGSDDAPCAQAPNSGVVIQTPDGAASVRIRIDEVIIDLNGTAFVTSQADGDMTTSVVDGAAVVTAQGDSSTAVAGTQVTVPLQNGAPVGVPGDPQAYDTTDVQALPTTLLPNPVDVAPPLTVIPGQPIAGNWLFSWGVSELSCPDGTLVPFASAGVPSAIRMDGTTLVWGDAPYAFDGSNFTRTFTDDLGNVHQDVLTVASPDRINGVKTLDLVALTCTLNVPFTLTLVSAAGD